jgi:hypothetical protein
MSANNVIFIDRNTNNVYYQGCADNNDFGELIGKGTDLDKAVDIAEEYINKLGGDVEYGIRFVKI